MNTPAQSQKPKPLAGIDIRSLAIGPQEAFVLSRVDGLTTVREIGYATSLDEEQVESCLNRLESLGAIQYNGRSTGAATPKVERTATSAASPAQLQREDGSKTPAIPCAPSVEPSALEAPSDLDVARRREIIELYQQLELLDHYELLGVMRNADRRAIKTAYYDKVKVFHPDRYFGKDLGPYRTKLEQCFARLTEAHDTLASATSREEYDAYLDAQRETRELERMLSQSVTLEELDLLEERMLREFSGAASASGLIKSLSVPGPISSGPTVVDISESTESQKSNSLGKMSDDDRRRFLARKLRVSSASLRAAPRNSDPPSSPQSQAPSREQIAEQLRRQLAGAKREDQTRRIGDHVTAAGAALAANDPVAASNALRVAHSLAPNDAAIAEKLAHAQTLAAAALSDTYLRQGEYEEKSGRFEAAARSYERAARGKPSAQAWEGAARCLLEGQVDLRAAAEFARLALNLNPEQSAGHLLLGRIFLAAGMRSSAVVELERARRIDPNNDTVLILLKRIANSEI